MEEKKAFSAFPGWLESHCIDPEKLNEVSSFTELNKGGIEQNVPLPKPFPPSKFGRLFLSSAATTSKLISRLKTLPFLTRLFEPTTQETSSSVKPAKEKSSAQRELLL